MAKCLGWSRLQHHYGSSTFSVEPPPILPTTSLNSPKDRKEGEGKGEVEGGAGSWSWMEERREGGRREAGSQRRAAAAAATGVTPRALKCDDFADAPKTSAGLHDGWRLNAALRLKLGSHPSISNKNPEVGMTRDKSTIHQSHPGIIFSIICLLHVCVS